MKCPYCEGEMLHGHLFCDGRSGIHFQQEGKKLTFWDQLAGVGKVITKGRRSWAIQIEADYCEKCRKIIFDAEVSK